MVDANMSTPIRPLNTSAADEVYISGTDAFHFIASGVELEGGKGSGVDVQFPWEGAFTSMLFTIYMLCESCSQL